MCGIAGIARESESPVSLDALARMAGAIRHRGPDGYGFYLNGSVGFAHVRLSIVDLARGAQPLTNEDGRVVITYNGEVYNHPELRRELETRGHVFRTASDTEVVVHGYEEWGSRVLDRLNGQFAFAIHDARTNSVFLARDRFGVRPLFYSATADALCFASELKALFASGEIEPALDPVGLDDALTFWGTRPPRTPFRDVACLAPGTFALWRAGSLRVAPYYELDFPEAATEPRDALERLDDLMHSSVALRMRADVPVGAYISGGLDSSITATLAAAASPHQLRTFSITFQDERLDESPHQRAVAQALGTRHAVASMDSGAIAEAFPDVVWHAETPLLRTAPAPMYHLARLVKSAGIKVVLTGEGADELFLGYDLFKEVAVRLFCLRRPQSRARPLLFDRLYPYQIERGKGGDFWRKFFVDAGTASDPLFSHLPRLALSAWLKQFYAPEYAAHLGRHDRLEDARAALPAKFSTWSPLNRAAYLEMTTLLSPYLLSSQADRMAMAHGVEGRYPFLDHRLFEFAASLPTSSRLIGLREKEILRRWAARRLPAVVPPRGKQPYRAPDAPSFFGDGAPEWIAERLDPQAIDGAGVFAPRAVAGLVARCRAGRATSVRENQALVAILSTQLLHDQFIARPRRTAGLNVERADVLLDSTPAYP